MPFFLPVPDPANPWSTRKERPAKLDPAVYRAMRAGKINPWLMEHAEAIPGMLEFDFVAKGRLPDRHLRRIAASCDVVGARLFVAYVPFSGVASRRYAPALIKLGMDPSAAESLATDPRYRRQNAMLAEVCRALGLPLADATEPMIRAEAAGTPLFWDFDTHPRPAGYAIIAKRIHQVWREPAGAVPPQ